MPQRRRRSSIRVADAKHALRAQTALFEHSVPSLPPFASTPEEIKRAVERNAVQRGILLVKVLVALNMEAVIATVDELAAQYDKEEMYETAARFGIDPAALVLLDQAHPPVPYPYYFCMPDHLIAHPQLMMYYRNVAMLSQKVMRGIGLSTDAYELNLSAPPAAVAAELAHYLNRIVSELVKAGGVTPQRHIQMAMANLGDSLGGVARNEVGRLASAQVIRMLALHLHRKWRLASIVYRLKGRVVTNDEEDDEASGQEHTLTVSPEMDLETILDRLEGQRVKYRELVLRNGNRLLLDRQLEWQSFDGRNYRIGPDLHSQSPAVDMLWAGEIKGGADPAGSDEHWKTATQALSRISEACDKTGRPKPDLSFMATIIVERVAKEAQTWIDDSRLTSVYNLTKVAENPLERQRFLDDMTAFLGCD